MGKGRKGKSLLRRCCHYFFHASVLHHRSSCMGRALFCRGSRGTTAIELDDIEQSLWWFRFIDHPLRGTKVSALRQSVPLHDFCIALGAAKDDSCPSFRLIPGLFIARLSHFLAAPFVAHVIIIFPSTAMIFFACPLLSPPPPTKKKNAGYKEILLGLPPAHSMRDSLRTKLATVLDVEPRELESSANIHNARYFSISTPPSISRTLSLRRTQSTNGPAPSTPRLARKFDGHTLFVYCVALCADGERVVSGSQDTTAKVWNVATGQTLCTFTNHTCGVLCVALFSDDTRAITGGGANDKTVRIWEISTGVEERVFTGHSGGVFAVAVTPDSSTVVSASGDHTIRLWNVASGQCENVLTGHEDQVWCVALSPDGQRLVSGSHDKSITVWSMRTMRPKFTITNGHYDAVCGMAFTPNGVNLVSCSADKTIKVWNWRSRELAMTLADHGSCTSCVAMFPDGKRLASGSEDRTVRIWNLHSGMVEHTLEGHDGDVSSVAVSCDGKTLVSGSQDNSVRAWTLR